MFVFMSEDIFSYEIQALVKAFYPVESPVLQVGEPGEEEEYVHILLLEDSVEVSLVENGTKTVSTRREIDRNSGRAFKNNVKFAVYDTIAKATGKTLPWGTLTGVRPTKLVMELIEQGLDEEAVVEQMYQNYHSSAEKAELGYEVVTKEKELLGQLDYKNGYSVYIGIPFCPTTCLYCSFTSFALQKFSSYVEEYLNSLFKEIEYAAGCLGKKKLETIYIGGGTPTTLTADQLERLLEKVRASFDFTNVKEFTVEAGRPDSITMDKLLVLHKHQVSRISINPQTMKQETLNIIGRHHTIEQVVDTFHMAREAGFDNINMDLIAGLPNETTEDVNHTLSMVQNLNPDSITMHSLVLKRAAMLNMQKSKYGEFTFGDVDQMIELAYDYAKKNDMKPYYLYRQKNTTGSQNSSRENVGYAKEGKEGLYNILIMEEKHTILALGAGACSKFVFPEGGRIQRIENVKNVREYVNRIDEMILRKKDFIEGEYNGFI